MKKEKDITGNSSGDEQSQISKSFLDSIIDSQNESPTKAQLPRPAQFQHKVIFNLMKSNA